MILYACSVVQSPLYSVALIGFMIHTLQYSALQGLILDVDVIFSPCLMNWSLEVSLETQLDVFVQLSVPMLFCILPTLDELQNMKRIMIMRCRLESPKLLFFAQICLYGCISCSSVVQLSSLYSDSRVTGSLGQTKSMKDMYKKDIQNCNTIPFCLQSLGLWTFVDLSCLYWLQHKFGAIH